MSTEVRAEVQNYLDRVRAALADLPPSEVQDIVDDVAPQLAELADDLGEEITETAIAERLGEPEAYAAEVRAAAGYPAPPLRTPATGGGLRPVPRLVVWSLALAVLISFGVGVGAHDALRSARFGYGGDELLLPVLLAALVIGGWVLYLRGPRAVQRVAELPEVRGLLRQTHRTDGWFGAMLGYLATMQAAWWLLRAALFAAALPLVMGISWWPIVAIVLAVPAFVGSRWLGRTSRADRRLVWAALVVNAFLIGVGFALLSNASAHDSSSVAYSSYASQGGVWANGNYVSNVYAFDATGKPLDPVYLYDQDGRPISITADSCPNGDGNDRQSDVANRFPLPRVDYFDSGQCSEQTGVPFAVVIPTEPSTDTSVPPSGSVSTTPQVTPTGTSTATPTGTSPVTPPVKPTGTPTGRPTPTK